MRLTTLCYIAHEGSYLMLHRIRKAGDENHGKWIGVGGHLEEHESPREGMVREIREETGLEVRDLKLRGLISFVLPAWGDELTFLYTASSESRAVRDCPEGVLAWIPREEVLSLPLWEGDRVFLPLLTSRTDCFSLKLVYDMHDCLKEAILDGESLPLPSGS